MKHLRATLYLGFALASLVEASALTPAPLVAAQNPDSSSADSTPAGIRIAKAMVDSAVWDTATAGPCQRARDTSAFWHYKEGKERIKQVTNRDVKTVGILLDGLREPIDHDVADARRYVAHIWNLHADLVVHADRPEEITSLRNQVEW